MKDVHVICSYVITRCGINSSVCKRKYFIGEESFWDTDCVHYSNSNYKRLKDQYNPYGENSYITVFDDTCSNAYECKEFISRRVKNFEFDGESGATIDEITIDCDCIGYLAVDYGNHTEIIIDRR